MDGRSDYVEALEEARMAAGLLLYRRDPQVEDRARLDAALKAVARFPCAPDVPWLAPSKDSTDIPHGEGRKGVGSS